MKLMKVQLHSLNMFSIIKEERHFRPANVFLVINMRDKFCIHKSNELPRALCFVLLAVYDMPQSSPRNIIYCDADSGLTNLF